MLPEQGRRRFEDPNPQYLGRVLPHSSRHNHELIVLFLFNGTCVSVKSVSIQMDE